MGAGRWKQGDGSKNSRKLQGASRRSQAKGVEKYEMENGTDNGHRVQAAGFNLGPCILNLESPAGHKEE
jgi:hypothetical protein